MSGQTQPQRQPQNPHRLIPKPETGYTDAAAVECHDLIDQAEEAAHLHDPGSMYSTTDHPEPVHRAKPAGSNPSGSNPTSGNPTSGNPTGGSHGLEGAESKAHETSQKMQESGKHMTEMMGEKVGQMKEKVMGLGSAGKGEEK